MEGRLSRKATESTSLSNGSGSPIARQGLNVFAHAAALRSAAVAFMDQDEAYQIIGLVAALNAFILLERYTFKLAVNRLTPFTFVSFELVMAMSIVLYFAYSVFKNLLYQLPTPQIKDIPHRRLLLIGLLDFVSLSGMFVSGYKVSPSLVPIFMHANVFTNVLSSKVMFPARAYSHNQIQGAILSLAAVGIAAAEPIVLAICEGTVTYLLAALLFLAAVFVQSASNAYKEYTLVAWSQPIDVHMVSCRLFVYQLVCCILFWPALFYTGGLLNEFRLEHPFAMLASVSDGFQCVVSGLDFSSSNPTYECFHIDCSFGVLVLLLFVVSNLCVLQITNRILQVNSGVLGSAILSAFITSFVGLRLLLPEPEGSLTLVSLVDVVAFIVLVAGMYKYYSDPEPNAEVIASYSPVYS